MIRLWDLKEGTPRGELPTTLDSVISVTFSSDSRVRCRAQEIGRDTQRRSGANLRDAGILR